MVEILQGLAVLALANENVISHVFIGQVAIGLLAFLLFDFPQFHREGGVVAAKLHQNPIFVAVQRASGLVELLGQDNLAVDEVNFVKRSLVHGDAFLSFQDL